MMDVGRSLYKHQELIGILAAKHSSLQQGVTCILDGVGRVTRSQHVDPEILLVDEVLAVGDEAFVRKCLAKMDEFKRQGKTIVLTGHDLLLVERWCDAAILLEKGRATAQGFPPDVIEAYRGSMATEEAYAG